MLGVVFLIDQLSLFVGSYLSFLYFYIPNLQSEYFPITIHIDIPPVSDILWRPTVSWFQLQATAAIFLPRSPASTTVPKWIGPVLDDVISVT